MVLFFQLKLETDQVVCSTSLIIMIINQKLPKEYALELVEGFRRPKYAEIETELCGSDMGGSIFVILFRRSTTTSSIKITFKDILPYIPYKHYIQVLQWHGNGR